MITLTEYSKNGYDFKLHRREGKLAIFVGKPNRLLHSSENWEVVEVQEHEDKELYGRFYPAAEVPPGNNMWGMKGWTALDESHAVRILERELKRRAPIRKRVRKAVPQ